MLRHGICLWEVQDKTYSQNLQKTPYIAYFKRKRNINYNNDRFPIHKISSNFILFFLCFQLEMIKTGRKGWYIYIHCNMLIGSLPVFFKKFNKTVFMICWYIVIHCKRYWIIEIILNSYTCWRVDYSPTSFLKSVYPFPVTLASKDQFCPVLTSLISITCRMHTKELLLSGSFFKYLRSIIYQTILINKVSMHLQTFEQ